MAYEVKVAIEKAIVDDFMMTLGIWIAAEAHAINCFTMESKQYNERIARMQERAFARKVERSFMGAK